MRRRSVVSGQVAGVVATGVIVLLATTACGGGDPEERARRAELDQLRREVVGFRALEAISRTGLLTSDRDAIVSVSDTLMRDLLAAAFPVSVRIPAGVTVAVTQATVTFRANVARVDLTGHVRRESFPRMEAAVSLRGALDRFEADLDGVLSARLTVDDATVDTPTGVPRALGSLALSLLQGIVERGIPELTAVLPSVAIPVRVDRDLTLPGLGATGPLSIPASSAPLTFSVARVIAFQNRLWIIVHVERGAFTVVSAAP